MLVMASSSSTAAQVPTSPVAAAAAAQIPVASATPIVWTNSLGMAFVRVPAGHFRMGGVESPDVLARAYPQLERKRFTDLADEGPAHRVQISRSFYLGQHEVTVGQFRRTMALLL